MHIISGHVERLHNSRPGHQALKRPVGYQQSITGMIMCRLHAHTTLWCNKWWEIYRRSLSELNEQGSEIAIIHCRHNGILLSIRSRLIDRLYKTSMHVFFCHPECLKLDSI